MRVFLFLAISICLSLYFPPCMPLCMPLEKLNPWFAAWYAVRTTLQGLILLALRRKYALKYAPRFAAKPVFADCELCRGMPVCETLRTRLRRVITQCGVRNSEPGQVRADYSAKVPRMSWRAETQNYEFRHS